MKKDPSLIIDIAAIGDENQFKRNIRLFTLDKLLKRINKESSKIMMDHKEEDVYGTRTASFTLIRGPNNYIGFAEKKSSL